jgi:hypothetical protein
VFKYSGIAFTESLVAVLCAETEIVNDPLLVADKCVLCEDPKESLEFGKENEEFFLIMSTE